MPYKFSSEVDFYRYLTDHFTAKPEPRLTSNGTILSPKFDDKGNLIGSDDNYSPEESIERMRNGYGRSWPNGVEQPFVMDVESVLVKALVSFRRGYSPFDGMPIQGVMETQAAEGLPFTIIGEVSVVHQTVDAKLVLDAIQGLSTQIDNIQTGK
jgi:hypothetical protein